MSENNILVVDVKRLLVASGDGTLFITDAVLTKEDWSSITIVCTSLSSTLLGSKGASSKLPDQPNFSPPQLLY